MPSSEKSTKKDILIPVMGPTGSGKSYFINTLLKESNRMPVGTDLASCTTELGFAFIEDIKAYPDYRIVLVDTPGFDDTYKEDYEILHKISTWLKQSYTDKAKLGGVIYLHDISMDRLSGTARRNLKLFQNLCGDEALKNVVLGTTKWGRMSEHAEKREEQLKTLHWKPLIDKNSMVLRFDKGYESAWALVEAILVNGEKRRLRETVLLIQKELVNQRKVLPETQVATELRNDLKRALEMEQKLLLTSDPPKDDAERAELFEAQELVQTLLSQIRKLKIPLSRKFRRFFGI